MPLGKNTRLRPVTLIAVVLAISAACLAQKDPGLRAGLPGAGAPLNGFTPIELSMFQEGVQRAIQLEAWATQGVPNPDLFEAKVGGTAWKSKPSWYIVGRKDRTVHPDLERFFAKRMGATTYELESSHVRQQGSDFAARKFILFPDHGHYGSKPMRSRTKTKPFSSADGIWARDMSDS